MELEKSVIACLMLDKQHHIHDLTESCFAVYKSLYQTIRKLYDDGKAVDIVTVASASGLNIADLVDITNSIVTTANATHYIKELKLASLKRTLVEQAHKVDEIVEVATTADEALANTQALFNFKMKSDRQTQITDILQATRQNIENRFNNKETEKLYTGFCELDSVTCGLHKQELTIVAARPGIGKTAWALQLMRNLSSKGNRCIFFSREMSNTSLCERLLSAVSGVDSQTIRYAKSLTDDDFAKIQKATCQLAEYPILINDTASTVEQIRSFCHRVRAIDVVIVDYIGLCKTTLKTQNREREVSEISWALKSLSSEFDIPVVALSQLNRECAKDGREPSLTDLRDSGSLEQDASNVLFLHVPKETDETANKFDIKVIVAKQRNGPAGKFIWLGYDRKTFTFVNKERGA